MEKILIVDKIKSVFIFLLLLGLPIFLLIPSVSSTISDYDMNNDGVINILDIVQVANHLGESGTPGWIREDVDKNGIINMLDLMFVSNNYRESYNISVNDPPSSARIQKMSICYSGRITNSDIRDYIATHFDLCDTGISSPSNAPSLVADLKSRATALGKTIKVIGYYDSIFDSSGHPEDWYVHSTDGTRVTSNAVSTNYLMNVNPAKGWDDYYIQRAKSGLNSYSVYDGIFIDDCWHDPMYDTQYWSVSPSSWEVSNSNWKSYMVQFMGNLKSNLSSKIAMANVPLSTGSFSAICDVTHGAIIEHFVHKLQTADTDNGWSISAIQSAISQLRTQAEKGDIIAVVSGCNAGTGYEDWCKFCYACFSFAVEDPGKAYFAWNFMGSSPTTNPTWFQWMDDYNLGTPTDNYHTISGNVYERTFTNYYVLANLNNLGIFTTFTFNNTSYTLEGKHALFIQK